MEENIVVMDICSEQELNSNQNHSGRRLVGRKEIRKVQDVTTEWVPVPEWDKDGETGAGIYVKTLTSRARDLFEQSIIDEDGKVHVDNARAKFVILVACDEEGNPIFNSDDAEWLGNKSSKAIGRIYEAAQSLNGMRPKDLDKAVKN
jgi:hypothetical protein